MAITATNDTLAATSASTQAAAAAAVEKSAAATTSDRFLKLLVAQMQNQDPLNPMDNAQVTSQMAQINTVTGVEKLNASVTGLSGQFVQMQALQGAALVGHEVVVPGNQMKIIDKVGQGGYELVAGAAEVKVEVLSPAGQVVGTVALTDQDAGIHSFTWDAGSYTDASALTFRVSAGNGAAGGTGKAVAATPLMRDTVNAVSTSGNAFNLELATSGLVPYSTIKAFN